MTAPDFTSEELRLMLAELARREIDAQARVRTWRNVTLVLCVVLAVTLPIFALVAPHVGGVLVRIRGDHILSSGDLFAIELWGALGGFVGVIASISRIRLSVVNVGLRVAQLVLKPLAGGAVAVFGVVVIQGQLFSQVRPVADGSIAAYSALFGFAQEALTRMVDRRARALLDTATPAATTESAT